MRVARITAFVVGAVAILLAIKLQAVNVAFLVGLAFAVAASANLPVIVLSIFWRRFNTAGAVAGLLVGLISSIVLIMISPSVMGMDAKALDSRRTDFPVEEPGNRQHSARLPRRDRGNVSAPRAAGGGEVRGVERAREYRPGRGKGHDGLV